MASNAAPTEQHVAQLPALVVWRRKTLVLHADSESCGTRKLCAVCSSQGGLTQPVVLGVNVPLPCPHTHHWYIVCVGEASAPATQQPQVRLGPCIAMVCRDCCVRGTPGNCRLSSFKRQLFLLHGGPRRASTACCAAWGYWMLWVVLGVHVHCTSACVCLICKP
jgi:hypothetical protein